MPVVQHVHLRRSLFFLLAATLLIGLGISAGRSASAQTSKVTVTGILNIVYGDPITIYTVSDPVDSSKRQQLLIDDKTWQSSGVAVSDLNRTLVTVSGVVVGSGVQSAAVSSTAIAVADIKPAGGAAASPPAQPVIGGQAYVTLLCKFSDIATEQHPPSWYDALMGIGGNGTTVPTLDNYFRDSSYGNITLAGSQTSSAWRSLPQPMSYYGDGTNTNPNIQTNLHNLAQDCATAWAPDIIFAPFIGLNFVFNGAVFQTAWGGTDFLLLNGVNRVVGTTWFNPQYSNYLTVWSHEMGHAFGLAHSGSDCNCASSEYSDGYDVMGYGYYAAPAGQPYVYWGQHTLGYNKDKLGWIPAARKFTYSAGTNTVTLDPLGAITGNNYLLAQIPYPGGPATHFYTVELRTKSGSYENQLAVPATGAVIIHEVDTTRSVPALVQGNGTATNGPATNTAAYQWTAGRTWTGAGGARVVVNSVSSTSASVTIGPPAATPTVTGLSLNSGATTGAAPVAVTGTNFSTTPGGTTIRFGSTPATAQSGGSLTCTTTQCLVLSPAGAAGTVDITASVGGQTSAPSAADQFTYQSCTTGAASLTSPTGSSISTGTPSFQWGGGGCISAYHLYVGSSSGGADLFDGGQLPATTTSQTLSPALSLSGQTIYVRLWSLANGGWQSADRSYTMQAPCNPGTKADITSPVGGSITTGTPTFQWGGGTCVTQYYLYVGSSSGQNDLFGSGALAGSVTTATVSPAIPVDGRTIYVRLWSLVNGGFQAVDHSYIMGACNNGTKADITSPTGGSITSGTPTFQWGGGTCVTQYYLYVGNSSGQNDLFSAGPLASTVTSATVSPAIPVDGRTIYVRLWSLVNGSFQAVDHSYLMGACQNGTKADITSPVGSITTGTPTFQWGGGACVTQYYLYVGSSFGQNDLYSAGPLASTVTSATVSPAIPVDGRTIYVRLWSLVSGSYQAVDHSYIMGACQNGTKADISSPAAGPLHGTSQLFQWSGGACVTQYFLYIGSSAGQTDLYNSGSLAGTVTSQTVTTLPANNSTVYLRLWSLVNGTWLASDHTYVSAP